MPTECSKNCQRRTSKECEESDNDFFQRAPLDIPQFLYAYRIVLWKTKIHILHSGLTDETVVISWYCCGDKAIIKRSRIR